MTQPTAEQYEMMTDLFGGGTMGSVYAGLTRSALQSLSLIPIDVFEDMAQNLERIEAFGPFVDPTAFIQPNAAKNLKSNKEFARVLLETRRAIAKWQETSP